MRLINADELTDELKSMSVTISGRDIFQQEAKDCVLAHINATPTVDAVPVVRCAECIYRYVHSNGVTCECSEFEYAVAERYAYYCKPNDFCSHGAKMKG